MFLLEPFDYLFMKRALVGVLMLASGTCPMGVFLVLRRMSLIGDALSHAIFFGVSAAYALFGLSFLMMSVGGFISGVLVAVLSGLLTRFTNVKEDASFAGFVTLALALGVMLISMQKRSVDLLSVLFGSILAIGANELILMVVVSITTIMSLSLFYRMFIYECCDSTFFKKVTKTGGRYHLLFLVLVVCNLIAGFQTIGTLLSVGLMILPALIVRFWFLRIQHMLCGSVIVGACAGIVGLYFSYFWDWPAGPGIIMVLGVFYIFSMFFGRYGGVCCSRNGF